ncbi:MAG: TonB-dependent receptor [Halieaceae bacterium]|jgi:iron complex outermembrane recepter protein|nr:TonB-dependent receptor [Halieaceae bacterium]
MYRYLSLVSTTVLAITVIAPGQTQSLNPDNSATARADNAVLEEIIVTANRREQRLQDVAMSISAFGGEFFKDSGVTGLTDLEQYTPSLNISAATDARSTTIRIRGIGSVGSNSGIDPSVGVFIDGVYQGRAGMSIADLVDIERVEVLRGPQGTLYGKNTAAGAISIYTKKPSPELETELELVYANNQRIEARGMVNTPLGDTGHALRVTGFVVDGDHLYKNQWTGEDTNDAHKWGVKSRFLFDMDSAGELLITLDYSKEDTDCCALAVITYEGLSTLNAPLTHTPSAAWQAELGLNDQGKPILAYRAIEDTVGYSPPKADPFGDDYWFDSEFYNDVSVGGIAAEWNYELANEDALTFIGSWRNYESSSAYDGDFTAYSTSEAYTDVELDQYSVELRLTSPGGTTWEYLAGLYAYYSEFDSVGTFSMEKPLVESAEVIPGIPMALFFPDGTLNKDTNLYTTTSYAAFGQLSWNINDKLSTTLGLRYTYEKKEREGSQITTPESIFDLPPIAGPNVYYDSERSDTAVSPAINVRYFVNPDLMTYASVSRGFKSGGFNQRRENVGADGEFDEEIATNYELGWKGTWLDRRLQVNGTLYFVEYDDFQTQTFDGASMKVTNAGSLESYGTEIEVVYAASNDITLGTAIGYNKATYDDFTNAQCTVERAFYEYYVVDGIQSGSPGTGSQCSTDLTGETLDNAPEWTVSSYLQHYFEPTDNLVVGTRLEHSYVDGFFIEATLDPQLKNDSVNLINLRMTLTNPSRDWEVALWGRNLLDEEYYAAGFVIPAAGGFAGVIAPAATYGITLRLYN